jgi:hypothetical protein
MPPALSGNRRMVPPRRISRGWLLFAFLILLQYGAFRQRAEREVTWAYATHFDQNLLLLNSYDTFEEIRKSGVAAGLRYGLTLETPQGKVLPLQAAVLSLFLGASRLTALTLIFLYFAALEWALVMVVRWWTGRWAAAWVAFVLLAGTGARFLDAGGILDFRIDLAAACWYGVTLCLILRSGVFRRRGWALAAGAATGLLIDLRVLTSVLVAPVWAAILAALWLQVRRERQARVRLLAAGRLRNFAWAAALVLALSLPPILAYWSEIDRYYLAHVGSGEGQMRLREFGIESDWDFLSYYPLRLGSHQLGRTFWLTAALAALAAMLTLKEPLAVRLRRARPHLLAALVCVAGLLLPLAVLTLWPSRSPVVGALLVAPAVLCTTAGLLWIKSRAALSRLPWGWAAVALTAAPLVFLHEMNGAAKRALPPGSAADFHAVSRFYDRLSRACELAGHVEPKVAFDRLRDYLHPTLLGTASYERRGLLLRPDARLGEFPLPVTPEKIAREVAKSDYLVLTDPRNEPRTGAGYPFDESMRAQAGRLLQIAESEFVLDSTHRLFGQSLALYVRPALQWSASTGEWLIDTGNILTLRADHLKANPVIEMGGKTSLLEFMGGRIAVKARVLAEGRALEEIETSFVNAAQYSFRIAVRPELLPAEGGVQLELAFDRYVVPKDRGLNIDTRRLVVHRPEYIRLRRTETK